MCQVQFVELDQLREHQKTHRKRKAPSRAEKKKRRRNHGDFHCQVCLHSFTTREELFHHKLDHMEDPRPYHPVEPHFDSDDETMNALLRENSGLIFSHHHFTPVSASFNFPLTLLLNRDGWIGEIYQTLDLVANVNNDESFKINLSMGFILVNRDTGEYRFFVPHANSAFFKTPIRIDRPSSWRELYSQLDEEALKTYVTHHRENTKWIPLAITNVVIHLYYLGAPLGSGELPDYIKDHQCIIGLDKDYHHGTLYKDKLCGVRCLAFHLNLKEKGDGYRGLETRTKTLKQQWEPSGLDLLDVPQFEDTFDIDVDIYSLREDGTVIPRYLSEERHSDKMVLNLHDAHLSYVKNIPAYLKKYCCHSCGRHFDQLCHWKRHQGSCANATEYQFPGGFHKMASSIFDRLEEFDIIVPVEDRLYPWFIVYDFEAILSPVTEEPSTPRLKWLRKHEPISVSVASNVEGFGKAKCFVNAQPKELIQDMMSYMGRIADSTCASAQGKWSSALAEVESQLITYKIKLGDRVDDEDYDADVYNEGQKELEGLSEKEKMFLISRWESTRDKLAGLQGSLNHYCRQIPVLGFNSAKYDLNLALLNPSTGICRQ